MNIPKTEKWILISTSLLMWAGLAYFAGGPIFSDEMLYLDAGLRNVAEPSYGNRYFHIYLQKLFISLSPTPLLGVRIFWGLLIALTVALIYINARKLTSNSNVLHGLLGVAIFFSYSLLQEYSGEPAVDITAMAMTTIYLSVYVWGVRNEKFKPMLFVLGILAFLSLKTKETTIFINVLLIGLLVDNFKGNFNIKKIFVFFRPFLYGLLIGIGIFIILDGLILGNPFFAISPATFASVFTNYSFTPGFFNGPANWYKVYFLDDLMLPFLLFLLSGIQLQNTVNKKIQILWVYPLVMAMFVSWNMLRVPWGFIERFYFPALPVLAMLAPQAIRFKFPEGKKEWAWFIASLLMSAILVVWMRSYWLQKANQFHFEYVRMLDSVYYPILISILLGMLIWEKRTGWKWTIVQLFCIGALLISPLLNNVKYFITFPKVKERYETVFYPFEYFEDQLMVSGDEKMFVSADLKDSFEMLSRDPNDIVGMYNFFFDARISRDNVFLGYDSGRLESNLKGRDFSLVLLSSNDIELLKKTGSWEEIASKYNRLDSDDSELVFLLSM